MCDQPNDDQHQAEAQVRIGLDFRKYYHSKNDYSCQNNKEAYKFY